MSQVTITLLFLLFATGFQKETRAFMSPIKKMRAVFTRAEQGC